MVDAGLKRGIDNLAEKIKRGEQDAICEEFDKLKQTLYQKHGDFFKANSDKLNPDLYVSQFIEEMYNKLRTAKANMNIVKNSEKEVTNVDLLRRISQLEKIIYGNKKD